MTDWQKRAEALWGLLDDISTAADICHPADSAYYRMVSRLAEERSKFANSHDGFTLTWIEHANEVEGLDI